MFMHSRGSYRLLGEDCLYNRETVAEQKAFLKVIFLTINITYYSATFDKRNCLSVTFLMEASQTPQQKKMKGFIPSVK